MQRVSRRSLFGLLFACFAASTAHAADAARDPRLGTFDLGRLPLAFEANRGQFDRRAHFVARGRNETAFITDDGLVVVRSGNGPERVALRLRFVGSRHRAKPEGFAPLPGRSNYFIGNKPRRWHTDVPQYARVVRREAYPGVDVAYYQGRQGIEYDLIVAPGADPSGVRLAIEGAERVELADNGDLVLHTALGEIRQHKPIAYQGERDEPELVDGRYRILAGRKATEVRFELAAYDRERALVLDPVLDFATFFGGADVDNINGVTGDSNGDIYIAGTTYSDATTFPETAGAYQVAKSTNNDAFVAKLKSDGSQLIYATYVGGDASDNANAIAVDGNGQAAITGDSTSGTYPTANAVQGTKCSTTCGVVTKLNAAGNGLVFSTFLGGTNGTIQGFGVAEDANLNTYVTGWLIGATNFPTSVGAFQTAVVGTFDAFVVKYAAGGTRTYATLLGAGSERGNAIQVDGSGFAYVIGTTSSSAINGTTATTIGPGGGGDVFIAKLNGTGTAPLSYLTRIGGTDIEEGVNGVLDGSNNVFFTGRSFSSNLPSTPAAPGGSNVALFGALNATGTALTGPGLTWYGDTTPAGATCTNGFGIWGAIGSGIALDPTGNAAWVAGYGCPLNKFPVSNPIAGLSCSPSCNSDNSHTGSFLLRFTYSAPPPLTSDASKSVGAGKALATATLSSASPIGAAGGTNAYLQYVYGRMFGGAIIAGTTDGALPVKEAADPSPNGSEDGYVAAVINGLEIKITKTFEPASIATGGSTVVAIKVENPNAFDIAINTNVNDILPEGLAAEWNPDRARGILSDSPQGCNDLLGMTNADPLIPRTLRNGIVILPNGSGDLSGESPKLPPGYVCTVRFVVYDEGYEARVATNRASVSTNNIGSADSFADLTITSPPAFTWTGNGGNGFMSNGANWFGGMAPTNGAVLVFPSTATLKGVINDLAGSPIFSLVLFNDPGYSLIGNPLIVSGTLAALGNVGFTPQIVAPMGGVFETADGATSNFMGGIDIPAGTTGYMATDGAANVPGPLDLDGKLVLGGPGLTTLNGTLTASTGSFGVGDGKVEIDANYQPVPLTIGAPGTVSGSGSVGAVSNQGVLRAGSLASPYASFGAASYATPSSAAVFAVNAQAAGARPKYAAGAEAVAIGTSSKLMVTGGAALGGTLEVTFDAPPTVGASYVVVSAGSRTGGFVRTRATPANVFGDVTYTGTTATYTVGLTTGLFRDGFE